MHSKLKTQSIKKGVYFSSIADDRYKTNRISVNFILKLDSKSAGENAILPYILEKSSEDYPNSTLLSRELDRLYGAAVGGSVKKIGDLQVLSLAVSFIDDKFAFDGENMTRIMANILAGAVLRPFLPCGGFASDVFSVEKQNLIDLIESEINEKREYAISRTQEIMGRGEPYGVNRFGSRESAEGLTAESVLNAYKNALKTARIEILFVGCQDGDTALGVFKSAFEKIDREYKEEISSAPAKVLNEIKTQTDRFDVAQSKLVLGFKTEQKSEDIDSLRVMTALYGGTPVSKLFLNVREKMSLCYYCAARYDRIKGVVLVDSGVETDNVEKAKKEILNQLEEIKKGNISDEELRFTKLSLKNSFKTIGDSAAGLESWYLGQRIAGTRFDPQDEAEKIDAVSKEDIVKASKLLSLDTVYLLTGKE